MKKEQGSALLWGLVILLVMTVMGVAATRMAGTDSRIAGNQMMYMLTFQGADSMLRKSASLFEVKRTAEEGIAPLAAMKGVTKYRPLTGANGYADAEANGGSGVTAVGTSSMGMAQGCPPLKGIAMTTEMTPDTGGLGCRVFIADISASLSGTGARSHHVEGVLKPVPPTN
jgi:hypothetical protein